MTRDPLVELERLRPDPAALAARYPVPSSADDVLARRRPRSRRGALIGVGGLAAAAAAVFALVPASSGPSPVSGSAPAQGSHARPAVVALHRLARLAALRTPMADTGRYLHLVTQDRETGGGAPAATTRLESWVDTDGTLWRHDHRSAGDLVQDDYYRFPPGGDDVSYPTPSYLATLPTAPDELYAYLDAHVSGSNSHEEAIFVGIGDMLRGGFAPPALRSAAVEVLARLPHVTLASASTDALGRPVRQFVFADDIARADVTQSLSFDPQTAQIIDEGYTEPGGEYGSSVVTADRVDEVPADVLAKAKLQHG